MRKKHHALAAAAALIVIAQTTPAHSQEWPEQPVHIIVPFSASGGTDIQARILADAFSRSMNGTFLVDNKPGASGLIGAQHAAAEPANGYTILFTTATLAINPTLYGKRWTVDPLQDLEPVSWITSAPLVLIVHPSVPARSVTELVSLAKQQPGLMNTGINTPGSTSHLAAEMLKQKAGLELTLVPFKGGGPAVLSVIRGETDFLFATGPAAASHIRSHLVRGLAVTTPKRSSAFPDLPTMNTFYPGFETDNWYAMFVRKGTPPQIVQKLNAEIREALKTERVRQFIAREGLDAVGSSPQELSTQVRREMEKYREVIRVGQISLK